MSRMDDSMLKRKVCREIQGLKTGYALGKIAPDQARQYFHTLQDQTGDCASPFRGKIASIVRKHKQSNGERDWVAALNEVYEEART